MSSVLAKRMRLRRADFRRILQPNTFFKNKILALSFFFPQPCSSDGPGDRLDRFAVSRLKIMFE